MSYFGVRNVFLKCVVTGLAMISAGLARPRGPGLGTAGDRGSASGSGRQRDPQPGPERHRQHHPPPAPDRTPRHRDPRGQGQLVQGGCAQGVQGADQGAAPRHQRRRPQPGGTAPAGRLGLGPDQGQPELQVKVRPARPFKLAIGSGRRLSRRQYGSLQLSFGRRADPRVYRPAWITVKSLYAARAGSAARRMSRG